MKHGISYIQVDNTELIAAIASDSHKSQISYLKQAVAYEAVYGFEYSEQPFSALGAMLCNDYGFSPFKYKSVEEGAIYHKDKHPHAYGRVRGRANVNSTVTWVCLDVDDTTITDTEMHTILRKLNHHIARTSNPANPYKYRILLELSEVAIVDEDHWKPFIKSIADTLGIKVDSLGRSQVFYGYSTSKVYSTIDQTPLSPSTHLEMASMKVAEILEKRANALPPGRANEQLSHPYNTFAFAYDAEDGAGTTMLLGAIHKAKELNASEDYIMDLVYSINSFWDNPMSKSRLESTVMSAI